MKMVANEMLDSFRDDPNLLQRVITGDEAWVYGYDVEPKAQSSQWKLLHEPRPKKVRLVRSNVKVLLTVFFDCRGWCIMSSCHRVERSIMNITCKLCAICAKQSARNARICGRTKIGFCTTITPLLIVAYLAPCDFFLFPKLKRPMKGRRYATLDEIKTASKEELKKILKNYFLKCFEDWKNVGTTYRIKRWSFKLAAFNYTVGFRKSSDNSYVDALSRLPLESSVRESLDEDQVLLLRKLNEVPFSFREVAYETSRDKILENPIAPYYKINEELSLEFGCLQWRERVVIPQKLRSLISNDLREMHMGIVKIKMIAKRYFLVVRIGMPPATISEWTWPEKQWHRLHLDLAGPFMGRMFLVLVDAYSKWIEIFILKDITRKTILSHLGEIFARFVLPEFLVTNNGRQFVSGEFEQFTKMNGIRHTKTSPNNPSTKANLQRFLFAHRPFPQTVIKEFPRGTANEEKFEINILEFNTKIGNPREVFHEAVRRQKQFTTGCEVYFHNYATGPKWKKGTILKLLSCHHYLIGCEGLVYKRFINQLRPVRKKQGETRNLIPSQTSGEKSVGGIQKESEEEVPEVTSGNKEETAAVHVPSCTPRPGTAAVQVPSCSPKPEPAAVQVPVRSPKPQRARKPLDRLEYY
ncbi:K02A2.6-like [Cordylochernes scorpioides]|uniref:K02A2.6-like n=1 Tax=Cordylochernes scorpioides TaxID=51811 RepID=A0ABY6KKQ9_9ARAC|nr:K02A2.6-like [Cordylochernes scorpioides]